MPHENEEAGKKNRFEHHSQQHGRIDKTMAHQTQHDRQAHFDFAALARFFSRRDLIDAALKNNDAECLEHERDGEDD